MQENPPPRPKERPPLKTVTTTVIRKQDTYPSGKKGPVERTVVKIPETTKVKNPPKPGA